MGINSAEEGKRLCVLLEITEHEINETTIQIVETLVLTMMLRFRAKIRKDYTEADISFFHTNLVSLILYELSTALSLTGVAQALYKLAFGKEPYNNIELFGFDFTEICKQIARYPRFVAKEMARIEQEQAQVKHLQPTAKDISPELVTKIFISRKAANLKERERQARLEEERAKEREDKRTDQMLELGFLNICKEQNIISPSKHFEDLIGVWREDYKQYKEVIKEDVKELYDYIKFRLENFVRDYYEQQNKQQPSRKELDTDQKYAKIIEKVRQTLKV